MDGWIDRQIGLDQIRWIDRKVDRQTDWIRLDQIVRQLDSQIDRLDRVDRFVRLDMLDRLGRLQINRQMDRQIDEQIDRQIDRQTDRQTDRQIDQIDQIQID